LASSQFGLTRCLGKRLGRAGSLRGAHFGFPTSSGFGAPSGLGSGLESGVRARRFGHCARLFRHHDHHGVRPEHVIAADAGAQGELAATRAERLGRQDHPLAPRIGTGAADFTAIFEQRNLGPRRGPASHHSAAARADTDDIETGKFRQGRGWCCSWRRRRDN